MQLNEFVEHSGVRKSGSREFPRGESCSLLYVLTAPAAAISWELTQQGIDIEAARRRFMCFLREHIGDDQRGSDTAEEVPQ
jgi:hypothetical protein